MNISTYMCLGALIFALLNTATQPAEAGCWFGCSKPSTKVIRTIAEQQLHQRHRPNRITISQFSIINTGTMKVLGMQAYRVKYKAVVVFPQGNHRFHKCKREPQFCFLEKMRGPIQQPGSSAIWEGELVFRKTDQGWEGPDGRMY